jgi:hypothetical protein
MEGVYTNLSIMTRVITGILDQCLRVCVYDIGGGIYELVNHDPCYNWDIRSASPCLSIDKFVYTPSSYVIKTDTETLI